MTERNRNKIRKPKKSIIFLFLIIVYICLVCFPYSRQGTASEETQQNFKLDEFFSDKKSRENRQTRFSLFLPCEKDGRSGKKMINCKK